MKRIFSIVLFIPLFVYAQEGIRFEEGLSWNQVLQKAKAENKFIFVDCYATWCGPCKYMDRETYPNNEVGKFFNEKFVSVKIQMDTSATDNDFTKRWYNDANMIMQEYKVKAFPTFLFFSSNGQIVHKDVGAFGPEHLITVGADALNPNRQYYTALFKYQRNELDTAYMKNLARKIKAVESDPQLAYKIANDFLNRLKFDELFTKDNIQFMFQFTNNSKDKGFEIFKNSSKRISETDERVSESDCKYFVLEIIKNEEIAPYTKAKKGKPDWKKIETSLKKYGALGEEAFTLYQPGILFKCEIEPALKINSDWNRILPMIEKLKLGKNSEFVVGSSVVYYLNGINFDKTEKNCRNLVAAATYYADSFPTFLTTGALNDWAWTVFEHSNEMWQLEKAIKWLDVAIKMSNDPALKLTNNKKAGLLDTKANLMYKAGMKKDAITLEKQAVSLSPSPWREAALRKMEKGEKTWGGEFDKVMADLIKNKQ